jgi:hypothetical protein
VDEYLCILDNVISWFLKSSTNLQISSIHGHYGTTGSKNMMNKDEIDFLPSTDEIVTNPYVVSNQTMVD